MDYKEMYFKLYRETGKAIAILTQVQIECEELIENLVLSAMGQGGSREEQTVLALNELGGNLGFLGELRENPFFLG